MEFNLIVCNRFQVVESVMLGHFQCPAWHPRFVEPWRARGNLIVFPRVAVMIHQEGRNAVVANPNVVMLYNRDLGYRRERISEFGDRAEFLDVSSSVLVDSISRYEPAVFDRQDKPFSSASCSVSSPTLLRQRTSFQRARLGGLSEMELEELALQVVDDVVDHLYQGQPVVRENSSRTFRAQLGLVNECKTIMSRRFREPLTIGRIAAQLDVSASHLRRVFRQHANESLHQYLTKLRLRTALEQVCEAVDLTGVALSLGFSSHSHFTSAFRRAFGMTPSDWRRQCRG